MTQVESKGQWVLLGYGPANHKDDGFFDWNPFSFWGWTAGQATSTSCLYPTSGWPGWTWPAMKTWRLTGALTYNPWTSWQTVNEHIRYIIYIYIISIHIYHVWCFFLAESSIQNPFWRPITSSESFDIFIITWLAWCMRVYDVVSMISVLRTDQSYQTLVDVSDFFHHLYKITSCVAWKHVCCRQMTSSKVWASHGAREAARRRCCLSQLAEASWQESVLLERKSTLL